MIKLIRHRKCSLYLLALLAVITIIVTQIPIPSVTSADAGSALKDSPTIQLAPLNPDSKDQLDVDTPDEYYGYMPPPLKLNAIPETTLAGIDMLGADPEPSYFDWRDSDKITTVKDQNPCGTCWAFGVISALESKVLIDENISYDFSEQSVVVCTDPAFVYLTKNRCSSGGNSFIAAETLIKKGSRLESCQPYNTGTINSESCNNICDTVKVLSGYRLITDNGNDISKIKDAIYGYGPVSMAFSWSSGHLYAGNIYYWPDCSYSPNHMVSIVGWNDSIPHPSGGGTGAWIVKNSWGTDWGDNGYFYLCYGSGNMEEVASYRYRDYNPSEKLYYWDEAGMLNAMGNGRTDSAWMASVFTSTQNGNITSVDFWVPSSSAQYQLYIYNSKFGTLLTSQTGICAEAGYYSIPLNSPVYRSSGQQFTVAVKMTTPGYYYPIPVEYVKRTQWEPPIQTGVSFYRSSDSGSYSDLARSGFNACLRASITSAVLAPTPTPTPTPITPPSAPTLTSPANRATGLSLTPTLQWSTSTGADTYNLQISTTSSFSAIVLSQTGITNTAFDIATDTLIWNTRYYWRMNAQNSGGTSSWSSTRYFTTAYGPPPDAPCDLSATAVSSSQINLAWTDNSSNETGFRIERKTGASGSYMQIATVGAGVTSYSNTGLASNTTYYYRVRAYNSAGNSDYTGEAYNTTLPPPPSKPTLVFPTNRASGISTTPTLQWNTASGADTYNLQISTSSSFATTTVYVTGINSTSYTVGTPLNAYTRYYWRVAAVGATGSTSAWSSSRYFRTAAP